MFRATLATLGLVAAGACGGSAFTEGSDGGADAGKPPIDATAESTGSSGGSSSSGSSGSSSGGSSSGSCEAGSACQTGYCNAGACASCTVDTECAAGKYCVVATGDCRPTLGNGDACARPAECTSGFCADGVCCSTACTGTCVSCNEPSSAGTCSPVPPGMNNPTRSCPAPDVCCGVTAMGTACTNTQDSVDNCGSCGNMCPGMGNQCVSVGCSGGNCTTTNEPTGTHCDGGTCSGGGTCL